uniref:C2H2-type domain-containing protein n=1 Tax=Trichuris muris TaxID=70415 RepID=A0A5S6R1Q9_TRIMR
MPTKLGRMQTVVCFGGSAPNLAFRQTVSFKKSAATQGAVDLVADGRPSCQRFQLTGSSSRADRISARQGCASRPAQGWPSKGRRNATPTVSQLDLQGSKRPLAWPSCLVPNGQARWSLATVVDCSYCRAGAVSVGRQLAQMNVLQQQLSSSECVVRGDTPVDADVTALSMGPIVSAEPKKFTCQECGKAFNSVWYLKQHAVKHSKDRPFTCKYCSRTYRFRSNLYQHKCPQRDLASSQGQKSGRWRKKEKKEEKLACLPSAASVIAHAMPTPQERSLCPLRSDIRSPSSEQELEMLYKEHQDAVHKCHRCYMVFPSQEFLTRHLSWHNSEERKVQCALCSELFDNDLLHDAHQHSHSSSAVHTCNFCHGKFCHRLALKRHLVKCGPHRSSPVAPFVLSSVSTFSPQCFEATPPFTPLSNLNEYDLSSVGSSTSSALSQSFADCPEFCGLSFGNVAPCSDLECSSSAPSFVDSGSCGYLSNLEDGACANDDGSSSNDYYDQAMVSAGGWNSDPGQSQAVAPTCSFFPKGAPSLGPPSSSDHLAIAAGQAAYAGEALREDVGVVATCRGEYLNFVEPKTEAMDSWLCSSPSTPIGTQTYRCSFPPSHSSGGQPLFHPVDQQQQFVVQQQQHNQGDVKVENYFYNAGQVECAGLMDDGGVPVHSLLLPYKATTDNGGALKWDSGVTSTDCCDKVDSLDSLLESYFGEPPLAGEAETSLLNGDVDCQAAGTNLNCLFDPSPDGIGSKGADASTEVSMFGEQSSDGVERACMGHPPASADDLTCGTCARCFDSSQSLHNHFIRIHVLDQAGDDDDVGETTSWDLPPTTCPICAGSFDCEQALRAHVLNDHNPDRRFICNGCGDAFARRNHLKKHEALCINSCDQLYASIPFRADGPSADVGNGCQSTPVQRLVKTGSRQQSADCLMLPSLEMALILPVNGETKSGRNGPATSSGRGSSVTGGGGGSVGSSSSSELKCRYCSKVFMAKRYLKKHESTQHKAKEMDPDDASQYNRKVADDRVVACPLCPKMFSTVKLLKQHVSFHNRANSM